MVWVVEKKIFRHILDMDFERVEIPVRVKFEFEVVEGSFVHCNCVERELEKNRQLKSNLNGLRRTIINN